MGDRMTYDGTELYGLDTDLPEYTYPFPEPQIKRPWWAGMALLVCMLACGGFWAAVVWWLW